MRTLTRSQVEQIAACADVYSATDTARHFHTTPRRVRSIWSDDDVPRDQADPPDHMATTTTPYHVLVADAPILAERGLTVEKVAAYLGVSTSTLYRAHAALGVRVPLTWDQLVRQGGEADE